MIRLIDIFAGHFQDFDHGAMVVETVPASWGLKPGDTVEYDCGQEIYGDAKVVGIAPGASDDEVQCTIVKVT